MRPDILQLTKRRDKRLAGGGERSPEFLPTLFLSLNTAEIDRLIASPLPLSRNFRVGPPLD